VINLTATPDETRRLVMTMITDPARVRRNDPGHPEICNVCNYHKVFSPPERYSEIERDCRTGTIGCTDCKKELAERINALLAGYRDRYQEISEDPDQLMDVVREGNKRADEIAAQTSAEMKEAVFHGTRNRVRRELAEE
jgi:tryptophanyl-tRNA synthetase